MLVNALIGAVSTLVLFFLQAKLPLTGMNSALLGPALFVMGLGAALGSRMTVYFHKYRYRAILLFGTIGVLFAFLMSFTGLPALMVFGGFIGSFSDDFLEVQTDILLNDMIPSRQRATLMSVNSFVFSMIMIVLSTVFGWSCDRQKFTYIEKTLISFFADERFFSQKRSNTAAPCQSAVRGLRGCASPLHIPHHFFFLQPLPDIAIYAVLLFLVQYFMPHSRIQLSSDIAVPDQPHMVNGFFKAPHIHITRIIPAGQKQHR